MALSDLQIDYRNTIYEGYQPRNISTDDIIFSDYPRRSAFFITNRRIRLRKTRSMSDPRNLPVVLMEKTVDMSLMAALHDVASELSNYGSEHSDGT
jgi:hypothetical protein